MKSALPTLTITSLGLWVAGVGLELSVSTCALREPKALGWEEVRLTRHVPDGLPTVLLSQGKRLQHLSSPLYEWFSLDCIRGEQCRAQGPKEAWREQELRYSSVNPGPVAF